MKILCLQLARFGDIYQTWPALNALRRQFPDATIDLVVRERFVAATHGLTAVDRVVTLPSKEIFAPLLRPQGRAEDALLALSSWLKPLAAENYDRICNLSFSPVSSYLTEILSGPQTLVTGYSRFSDGFLNIVDDASSYFYAQVGVERMNRIHVTDLFALVARVELVDNDLKAPSLEWPAQIAPIKNDFVVIHTGASTEKKRATPACWRALIDEILSRQEGDIVLVGQSGEDEFLSGEQRQNSRLINLTGKTELPELFAILSRARILIATDSVAMHMASLTQTPTLNISFAAVRFWETGPRAKGSRVVWFESPDMGDAKRIAIEISTMIDDENSGLPVILKEESFGVIYKLVGYEEGDFSWELARALYMSQPFPTTTNPSVAQAFHRLNELAVVGLEQIRIIRDGKKINIAASILDQIDHLLSQVDRLVPSVGPVIRWFQAEKCRIGPGPVEEILDSTGQLFQKLGDISQLYALNQKMNDALKRENLTWKS